MPIAAVAIVALAFVFQFREKAIKVFAAYENLLAHGFLVQFELGYAAGIGAANRAASCRARSPNVKEAIKRFWALPLALSACLAVDDCG